MATVNLNELASKVTLKEGKKKSVSVAQVKEVMKILLTELAKLSDADAVRAIRRYRRKYSVTVKYVNEEGVSKR